MKNVVIWSRSSSRNWSRVKVGPAPQHWLCVFSVCDTKGSQILVASGLILFLHCCVCCSVCGTNGSQILVASGSILFYLEILPDKLEYRCGPRVKTFSTALADPARLASTFLTHVYNDAFLHVFYTQFSYFLHPF